jgi:hypothetical protein
MYILLDFGPGILAPDPSLDDTDLTEWVSGMSN